MPEPRLLDPLTRAAIRSGSDKYGGHVYTPIYHKLFASRREEPVRLLEIGIGGYDAEHAGGLGLKMWAEYFPNGTIIGLDISRKTLDLPPRVRVIQGSQTDDTLLVRLSQEYGPFDIVIDDGSHVVSHMLGSFRTLYPLIAPDGIYAIEDTQTSFEPVLGGSRDGAGTVFQMAHSLGLLMHKPEGYVDSGSDPFLSQIALKTQSISVYRNIVAFQRGSNTYPSNSGLDLGHPDVRAVFDSITAQDARDPSPTGVLSRLDMLIHGGKHADAARLAMNAATTYPQNVPLLYELSRMMEWCGQIPERDQIEAQLSKVK